MCQLAFIVSVSRVQLQVPLDQQFAQAPGGLARFLNLTKMGLGASKHPLTYILALLPELLFIPLAMPPQSS